MTLDSLVRTITAILAPVVMVTSCSIFLGGLFTRYEAVSSRMRSLHRERFDLLDQVAAAAAAPKGRERRRIEEIERQLPGLLHRHLLIRNAVLAVAAALIALVAAMFLIAGAELTSGRAVALAALAAFLLGTAAFLAGVTTSTIELWRSHYEVAYEIEDGLKVR